MVSRWTLSALLALLIVEFQRLHLLVLLTVLRYQPPFVPIDSYCPGAVNGSHLVL
jgi:hypothetical protein